tara:strand:+ start:492 stop:821 length:330 start_codon:yes stop_codon:yes gene_type:complete
LNFHLNGNTAIVTFNDNVENKFLHFLDEIYSKIKNKNIILNFNNNILKADFLNKITDFAVSHQKMNLSFVIVSLSLTPDIVPELLVCSPTLKEAEDLIEMDIIQRDLEL